MALYVLVESVCLLLSICSSCGVEGGKVRVGLLLHSSNENGDPKLVIGPMRGIYCGTKQSTPPKANSSSGGHFGQDYGIKGERDTYSHPMHHHPNIDTHTQESERERDLN